MRRPLALALVPMLLLAASCSFVDRFDQFHAVDGGGQLTLDTFIPRFFDGLCQKSIRCETKLGVGALLEITCIPGVREQYLAKAFGNFSGFDPVLAQECLDGLASIDCSLSNVLFVSACERFLSGAIATGQHCTTDSSCANGRCNSVAGACSNVCVDRANAGDPCVNAMSDQDCDAPLRCRASTCQPAGQVGEACEDSSDCESLLWCHANGTCQPLPNVGDTCVVGATTDYADPCRGSLVCKLDVGGTTRSCQAGGTAGASCDSGSPCAPGHRCKAGICHAISGPGGTCVSKDDCPFSHECVAEICTPFGDVGDACSPTLPCFHGSCVGSVCTLLADGSTCDGSNGLLGGQCQGYCQSLGGGINVCATPGGNGAPCNGTYDDFACQTGLSCQASGAAFTCQTCF